ncbi:AraC family transcriptional regulator [Rhodoferax aquaticus]|uniref:AraC family transcriptional regulator n=1 Tax=Rhodoferax aquaticus TaxID=2527691 RepID=A0A515ELR1_9BURK|nr:AraC family transcriptional regulator [Rhodoferax aquaticus]QDL53596.1 AraC family transcriptional regulator [Rhodoferax aquaticus]
MTTTASSKTIIPVGFNPPKDSHLAVEVMSIAELRQKAPPEHFEKLQRADFYRLIGVLEGQTHPMVDFRTLVANAGDWLLVRPGQVFRYDFAQGWDGCLMVFRPDTLAGAGNSRAAQEMDFLRRVEDLQSLHALASAAHAWMVRAMRQMQEDAALAVEVAVRNELLRLQLATTLLRLSVWQSPTAAVGQAELTWQQGFRRFRALLESDFTRQHQVQHYAKALGMSDKTLSRACQAAAGASAKALIHQRLALEAKRLLAHTSAAMQVVAQDLGFDEATNFVKFFRKETGMTPLAFRKSV